MDRHSITFWSRVTGWQRAEEEVGTVSDLFRLLGRLCVFLLVCVILCVRVHVPSPCERSGERSWADILSLGAGSQKGPPHSILRGQSRGQGVGTAFRSPGASQGSRP